MTQFRNGKRVCSIRIDQTADHQWHPLFCLDCANIVTFHNGDITALAPGKAPIDLGVEIACKNKNCGKLYVVEGFSIKQ